MRFLRAAILITQRLRHRAISFRPSEALSVIALVGVVLISAAWTIHAQPAPQGSVSLSQELPENLPLDLAKLSSSALSPPELPQELPDFDQLLGTLGPNQEDPFARWRMATVIVRSGTGWGSGAFISSDGWLLTNYHVVAEAAQRAAAKGKIAKLDIITARIVDRRTKPNEPLMATLYRANPVRDLALLKLDELPPTNEVEFFELGEEVLDGEDCYVLGSQHNGPAWWLRSGNVSQQFDFPDDLSQYAAGLASGGSDVDRTRVTVIVTDARVSGGDSGGPLLNKDGKLIGLTFATSANSSQGSVGWHITLDQVREFIADLPEEPEGVPFDPWTAGIPSSSRAAELHDGDGDGRIDTLWFVHFDPATGLDSPLAATIFFDLGPKAQEGLEADGLVPRGLWSMETEGRFRFDFFLTRRADDLTAVGYTDDDGVLNEIRIALPGQSQASVLWQRDDSGSWQAHHPTYPIELLDEALFDDSEIARLVAIGGEALGGE